MEPFYEIIRIACSTQSAPSRLFSEDEWYDIFIHSQRHAIVGITFSALQTMDANLCPSKSLCREWIKMAESIRIRNRVAMARCIQVSDTLQAAGFTVCVLKGQSLSAFYGDLAEYRSSGDIDVWVDRSIGEIDKYVRTIGVKHQTTIAHVECDMFPDIPVEIHPQPAVIRCPWLNKRLKTWFRTFDINGFERSCGFSVAPVEFNLVYMLVHIQHHLLFEGVGLRQLMDYYFVLKSVDIKTVRGEINKTVEVLRLAKLSKGVMWIMREVFGLDAEHLLIEPDAKIGEFLLGEIMAGGNFGKYDYRDKMVKSPSPLGRAWGGIVRNARFFSIAPEVVICNPFWRLWHLMWRKRMSFR